MLLKLEIFFIVIGCVKLVITIGYTTRYFHPMLELLVQMKNIFSREQIINCIYVIKRKVYNTLASKLEKLCNEYRENKRCIEELETMNDSIKNDIIALMGNNDTMIEGAVKVTNRTINSTRFNSKEFYKAYPDLFKEYSAPVSYKRFTVY